MRPAPSHDLYSPREIALPPACRKRTSSPPSVATCVGWLPMPTPCGWGARSWRVRPRRVRGRGGRHGAAGRHVVFDVFRRRSLAPAGRRAAGCLEHAACRPHCRRRLHRDLQSLATRRGTPTDDPPADPMRLVFVATPGPGGGGGGGGLLQKAPPPKALREGRRAISSPLPERREPKAPVPVRLRPNRNRNRC